MRTTRNKRPQINWLRHRCTPVLPLFSVPVILTVEWVERQEMKETILGGTMLYDRVGAKEDEHQVRERSFAALRMTGEGRVQIDTYIAFIVLIR
jgi:hypothetical protein